MKLISALLLIALMYQSCIAPSKTKREEQKFVDSTAYMNVVSENKRLTTEVSEYRKRLAELEYADVSFDVDCDSVIVERIRETGCDPVVLDSVIKILSSKNSTIKRLADGSYELTGRISKFKIANEKLLEENINARKLIHEKDSIIAQYQVRKQEKSSVSEKEKKGVPGIVFIGAILLSLACFVAGAWVGNRLKLFTK